jgi:hypothetical protein
LKKLIKPSFADHGMSRRSHRRLPITKSSQQYAGELVAVYGSYCYRAEDMTF